MRCLWDFAEFDSEQFECSFADFAGCKEVVERIGCLEWKDEKNDWIKL